MEKIAISNIGAVTNSPKSVKTVQPRSKENTDNKNKATLLLGSLAALAAVGTATYLISKGKFGKSKEIITKQGEDLIKGTNKLADDALDAASNLPKIDKAKSKLSNLYLEIVEEANKTGNKKRADIYTDFIGRIKKGELSDDDIYKKLYDETYNKLRKADYPLDNKFNHKISDITGQNTPLMEVNDQGRWHYRLPKNRKQAGWSTSGKSIDRISVNALADEKLIADLDNLFANGKIKGYYKTPNDSLSWLERHDPVTIYLHETATPQILKTIEDTTKPYIRSTDDVLFGHKFAPGVALEKSPQLDEITNILDELKAVDPNLEKAIRKMLTKDNQLKASAGQMTAANEIFKLLK